MDTKRNFKLDEIRAEKPSMVGVYQVTEDGRKVGLLAAGDIANVLAAMPERGFDRDRASWQPQWGDVRFWTAEAHLKRLVDMNLLAQDGTRYTLTDRAANAHYSYSGSHFPR